MNKNNHSGFKILLKPLLLALVLVQGGGQAATPDTAMSWAYALNTPGIEAAPDDGRPKTLPNSDREFIWSEVNLYNVPDWHPDSHPEMPPVVANGRNPGVFACAYCHLPNGQGKPENASLAGLPEAYIIQQMEDYRNGLRTSTEARMTPPALMAAIGASATGEEVAEAAAYFASLKPKRWIRVVETDTVPANVVFGWMHIPAEGGGTEPIGRRIIEMPEDVERTELRDDSSGFVAYVPVGSVERGRELVETGGDGVTLPCAACHGEGLTGLGPLPALAGRSPTYMARQLYDFQTGARRGLWSPLMGDVVADLTVDDIIAITAYTSSLEP